MINAEGARSIAKKKQQKNEAARARVKKSRQATRGRAGALAVRARIQARASSGRNFVLCRSNKQACMRLKDDGFGCILLFNLALIWW